MLSEQKPMITNAARQILRPFVRILIRYGLSCPELTEMLKGIYIEVAEQEFKINNKKQTVSRIATLTGLSRKDVQKTKQSMEHSNDVNSAPVNRASRVILGWLKDPEFLDAQKKPATVPLRGSTRSFEVLVKRYSGDIPMKTILDELNRIGAVQELEGNQVQLLTAGYIPKTDEEKIEVMAKCVSEQFETIDFNLTHPPYEARFQRQIKYVDLPQELIKEFQEYSKERSIELIMEFNLWLSERKKQLDLTDEGERGGQVGFGLYYFQKDAGHTRRI